MTTTTVTKTTALFGVYIIVDTLPRALRGRPQGFSNKLWETPAVIISFRGEQVQG